MLDRQPTSSAVGASALSRADVPELRLVKPFAYHLPAPLTPFIGRRDDIASLTRRLAATRLLTLTGPGGSGKTRLALEVAQAVHQAEVTKQEGDAGGDDLAVSDGIWWVELAGLAEVNLLPQTVAAVLGVREQPTRPATDSLVEALRPRAMLLILDNCEHLVTGCAALVHSLLPHCPYLRILATSQTALNMGGETVWPVPPLSLPSPKQRPSSGALQSDDVERIVHSEAVQLFVARASAVKPDFMLTAHNAEAIAAICWRLDGMPLALELAAARVRLFSPQQIAARLDDVFRLLTRGDQAALPRHQTLRATVEWSHNVLTDEERVLLRRLAVFAGGFTVEAVEALNQCAPSTPTRPANTFDVLANLIDKSLVLSVSAGDAEVARYRLLETVRQYAAEKLAEAGEREALRHCHLDWCIEVAEQAEPELRGPHQAEWLRRLDLEHDNLRAALQWAVEHAVEAGLRLAGALTRFWSIRGLLSEGGGWLDQCLARSPDSPRLTRAKALYGAGIFARLQGDDARAADCFETSLAFTRTADRFLAASTLNNLAGLVSQQADYDHARALLEEALALFRTLDDAWGISMTLNNLAGKAFEQGDYTQARVWYGEGLAVARQRGDKYNLARILRNLGMMVDRKIDAPTARAYFAESLALTRELGDQAGAATSLHHLAMCALDEGDTATARALCEESLALRRAVGDPRAITYSLHHLGRIALWEGDYAAARAYAQETLPAFQKLGDKWGMVVSLERLGELAAAEGAPRTGARLLGAVEALCQSRGIRRPPEDQAALAPTLTALRSALGEADFVAAWAEGRALSLEAVIALALAPLEDRGRALGDAGVAADASLTAVPLTPQPVPPSLRLYALGPAQVFLADRLLTNADWGYAKGRELLFYLLCHPPRTREQIGLVFWPDASPGQLRQNLGGVLKRLRRALGGSDWILFENEAYTFNRILAYWFDVAVFERELERVKTWSPASPPSPDALDALRVALRLYRGDFLEDIPAEWATLRREELRRMLIEGWLALGRVYFAAQEYIQAADAYRQALARDNFQETAHRELMRCLACQGERGQALRHGQALLDLLRDELGVPPAAETLALLERLRRGEDV
ncbi:MAG: tetratricopeptide repeat protein [Anaerolineae bacterium]|nr:tetratricopeptide repeat protein [Anaerolineae bacterium]